MNMIKIPDVQACPGFFAYICMTQAMHDGISRFAKDR